jgi:DNA-binding NtrC family response regulator
MSPASIVVVEDDASLLDIARYQLERAGYLVRGFVSAEAAWESIQTQTPDAVITDLVLSGKWRGDDLLKLCVSLDRELPVILMTANGSIENAVACLHHGAWTYFPKPFRWEEMLLQISKALELRLVKSENTHLRQVVQSYESYDALVGDSQVMQRLKHQMRRIASAHAPVLILGESGTGKELVARSLHLSSPEKNGPFIAINCGAIASSLAESELFGHCKGAFTGAIMDKKGVFAQAHGGTLFLDEIGELALELQVKLLRVIQEGEVLPVGAQNAQPVNVRLISATHVELHEAIKSGEFREDLFYRISILPIQVPALRERREDIIKLSLYFLRQQGISNPTLQPALLEKLRHHAWPGNIRQLQNAMIRMAVLNPHLQSFGVEDCAELEQLPRLTPQSKGKDSLLDDDFQLDLHIRDLVEIALARCEGNQSQAARLLGITRSALIYRMQKFGLSSTED